MPERDKIVNLGGTIKGFPELPDLGNITNNVPKEISMDELYMKGARSIQSKGIADIPLSSIYTGDRYPETRPGTDYEEMAAQQQSTWNKWGNAIAKTVGITATSFVSGTAGLLNGIGSSIANWNFSKLFDNDTTRLMNRSMEGMEDIFPNYYTKNEQDADWWTPDNLLTANFWGDKVMKNIGYSLGSIAGGAIWSKVFKLIGATNTMVKAGVGLEAATTAEAAMTNVPKLQKFASLESALNSVSQTYLKSPAAAILKDSDRILTSVMGTFGEASLESLQNANAFRKQAIEDYRNTYGVDPTGADLENINAYANKVGNYTWGMNTLLLSATNYIQLPKILGSSRRAEKALINEIEQKQLGGAWSQALPGTRLGKLTDKITGVGKYLFSPTEAFEEGAQFAIQVGTNDFFDRAYKNKNELNSFLSAMSGAMGNVLDKGVDETLNTKEGLENILIGGISGGIQQIRGTIRDRRLAKNNTGIALGALNKSNVEAQLKDQAKFLSIGIGSQKLRQQAIKNNDVLSEKDYEKDFVLSYVMPRAKYGKTESIFQELGYYKSQAMNEVGFNELSTNGIAAPNETREQFIQRINNLEALTKTVDGFYDAINNKYSGLVDANGKRVYSSDVIDKMVYATAKINDYDVRIPALTLSLTNAGINTAEILTDILETGTPNKQATLGALDSINKMDVLSDVKDDLKRDLSDIIELSLRRKQFIDEYDAIKKAPQLYELGMEFDFSREEEPIVVEQFGVPEGKKRKKVFEKEVEFGKEYSLKDPIRREENQIQLSPTLTVIGRNLGGEYEVRLPNGTETFLTPEQFRAYELADSPMESAKLQELMDKSIDTVLNKKKYADISKPTENKLQYVNSLNNKGLMDDIEKEFKKRSEEFVKQQTKDREKRAKLSKYAEQIRKTQQAIMALSGDVPTGDDQRDRSSIWEDARKMFKRLFTSTTTASREWSKQGLASHIIRYNEFINNVKNFKNRDALKVILVTPKFAESLGLQGLAEMSFEAGGLNVKDINDPLTGFVGAVFIEVDKNNKKYFVDKNGERIAEVGPNATPALNRIVFSTMPSVNLYWSKGQPKFREGEEKQATAQAAAWQKMREQLFTTAPTQLYDFGVSKGIPVMNKENPETNFVGDVIVPANKVGTEQVVMVSTKGTIAHEDGNNYTFPVGRPVIKYGDVLTYLNNRTFTKNEAQAIFQILKNLSDVANDEVEQGATLTFDPRKVAFLRDIMYWNDKGDPTNNKIYIDPDTQELVLGMDAEGKEIRYPFANIGNFENQIVTQLQGMFNSVNNKTLNRGMGQSFTEFFLDKEGKLAERTWKNYQDYLLSSKLPDGSARSIKDAPLFTNISKPTNEVPYAFDQKYAYLKMELDAPAQPIVKEEVKGEGVKVGNYELNNGKVNDYNVPNMGAIQFTATIDDKGEINVTTVISPTTEATYQAISQNKDLIAAVKKNLVDIGAFVEGKDDIDYVAEAAPNLIKIALVKARQAAAPAAPAAPVSEIEQAKELYKQMKAGKSVTDMTPAEQLIADKYITEELRKSVDAELAALEGGKKGFQGYKGGFENTGKGTPQGDGKDKAMRQVADSAIVELASNKDSSSKTSLGEVGLPKEGDKVIMLARNGSLSGKALRPETKEQIRQANLDGAEFVVGDMPGVDSQFIDYLQEIGAKFTVYHTGDKSRITIAALEGAKPAEEKPNVADPGPAPTTEPKNFKGRKRADDPRYRRAGSLAVERMTEAELQEFKEWAAKNLPQIPYEVLEHMVNTHDNKKAWGVFEDGVAKFYRSAEKGTAYHELFEGVWKGLLSENMQQALIDEFRERKGSFIDRASGRRIDFNEATDEEAREYIADEFAAFRAGKATARTLGQKLVDFFRSIINFFKSFVNKPTLKDELFKAIERGEFKQKAYKDTNPSQMAAYRRVTGLNEQQTNEFVQDMTARLFQYVFNTNTSLFSPARITAGEIFNNIKEQFKNEDVFDYITDDTYNQLIDRTKEYLKYYRIEFDEDSRIAINDEGATNRNYAAETFSVDFKKASPYAVKLLIGTLIKTKTTNQENSLSVTLPPYDEDASSTGGYTLVPFGKAFTTLMNTLSNTLDVNQFVDKLYKLALQDGDYIRLFTRLGGDLSTGKIDFQGYKEPHDWRLFINFYQVFTKQNPDAVAQFMDDEKVYLGSANQASTAKQFEKEWLNNMLLMADEPGTFIQLDRPTKTYKITNTDFKIGTPEEKIAFLNNIGINFTMDAFNKLKGRNIEKFGEAVSGILTSLKKKPALLSLRGKALDIAGNLITLTNLYTKATNPIQDSTFFNMENKRQQSFTDSNTTSVLESIFNSVSTKKELLEKLPRLADVFSTNSQVLKEGGLFFDEEGNRTSRELKVGYSAGIKDIANNTGTASASLPLGSRFTLEINQNLDGNYYVLIPADSSTEWMMKLGNVVSYADIASNTANDQINGIFSGYLKDEILLAASDKNRAKLKNVAGRGKQLRFFNDILPDAFKQKIATELIDKEADSTAVDAFMANEENATTFNKAIASLIERSVNQNKAALKNRKELVANKKEGYKYAKIDSDFVKDKGINKNNITEGQLTSLLTFTNVNYMINNIELHKILLGDPYQFATKNGKLEETKRVKSYLSPRRVTFNIPEFNNFLNDYYNKAGDLQLTDDDYGYHEHKDFARTATISELFVAGSAGSVFPAYLRTKEADAASWMKDTLYREVKLKNGQWSDEAEAWHQWQMAFTRQNIPGYKYTSEKLRKQDEALVKKPAPTHFIDVLKPIVTGSKFGRPYTDNVLDKFAQIPLYYSAVKDTSLEKLYIKMFNEGYDYVIMESGRKEGTEKTQLFYQPNGKFNNDAFNNMIDVPWSAYGLQVENSYDKDKGQTRGSQGVKISSMDLFENGQPISEDARKAMDRYNAVLNEMTENAYREILTRLAIKDLGTSFEVEDKGQVAETLRQQMLKLQLSENAVDSISINPETGEFDIPFEASTNYTQIKQILYAIVNKSITSPKMNGLSAVQIPVTGWENAEKGRSLAIKRDGKYEKISSKDFEDLSDDDKKDVVLTDDTLKFYEDKEGKRYCEVMLPNWFKKKLGRDMTDEEFTKFANTEEGRKILTGIGFRIPTQGLNSMDVFVVKGFLPSYMGKTVVVPSEITTKAGSDFDIDKLNTYLKNVYVTGDGKVKLVPYFGLGEEAKKKMGKWLIENELTTLLTDTDFAEYGDREDDYGTIADKLYKQSLENEYYFAMEDLLTIPENFKRLMTPNSSKPLEDIAAKLDKLRNFDEKNVKNPLINRVFLTGLRHSFVTAKAWVGIAATNITGHSLFQKEKIYVLDGTMKMVLPHNRVDVDGKSYISLSGRLDQDGKFISDKLSMYANAFVDVANDPYIFKIIYSERLVSTFLFLERAGVPMETVAMFMNQPIIREYMNYLDSINASRSGIYNSRNIGNVKKLFPASVDLIKNVNINLDNLDGNISTYASKGSLSEIENAEQQAILAEFLKYSKLSDALFSITQATNYDTSSFKNADDLHRKQVRTALTEAVSIISSPEKILNVSFLRGIERALDRATDALGAILKFNQFEFRGVIEDAINVYAANQYLGAEKFTKIAEKLSASFLDYIVQTKIANKLDVNELTASVESVANRIRKAKGQHPEVKMLQLFITEAPDRPGAPKTIALRSNPKEAFDENLHIGYMREMRDNPATADLYKDVVKVAILQGTYQSAVSIKNIVPLEDYAKVVSPIISPLQVDEDVRNFAKGRKFERSNWKDETIVPRIKPTIDDENQNELGEDIYGNIINQYFYKNFVGVGSLSIKESDKSILLISPSSKGSNNDVLVIPGIFKVEDEMIDFMRGETITPADVATRRAQGDRSMDLVHGYMKVRDAAGIPILNPDGKFVYKRINLLGDGQYLTEHYVDNRPSAVDNGTYKVEAEIPDYMIIEAMAELQNTAVPRGFTPTPAKSVAPTAAVTPTPAVSQTEPVYQITKPTRSFKKESYTINIDGIEFEKTGYRMYIPGYPNAKLFITKDMVTGDDEVVTSKQWTVDEATTGRRFPTTATTIDGILEEIRDKVNEFSKNPENLKILKGIGIFQIQPEGLPAIDNNNQNNCG
jgi:hypothetical protein